MPTQTQSLNELLQEVCDVIAPVWPLKDYVAVNPFSGMSDRPFQDAGRFLRTVSDIEMLMPLPYFACEFQRGAFSAEDIRLAIASIFQNDCEAAAKWDPDWIASQLASFDESVDNELPPQQCARLMRTIAESFRGEDWISWTDVVRDEISKHCAAHYDEGQSGWISPWKHLPLYQAWHQMSQRDRNVEAIGLKGFRSFVGSLPDDPVSAIATLLNQMNIPRRMWKSVLCCQAYSIIGWAAWAKYRSAWSTEKADEQGDLIGLLAIRLAYDAAIGATFGVGVDWSAYETEDEVATRPIQPGDDDNTTLRLILQRGIEIAYRGELVADLQTLPPTTAVKPRPLAQMVFCIDVRSERIRRHLEAQSDQIETCGFAGFFGMPMEFVALGEGNATPQLPVLLQPTFTVRDGLYELDNPAEEACIAARQQTRTWRKTWKQFQSSAVGCFSFVETTGLRFAWELLKRTLTGSNNGRNPNHDGIPSSDRDRLGPKLRDLDLNGMASDQQVDLAAGMLRNLGLTEGFGRLVVFCGHGAQTDNNPLHAGLECGACGGHSGEPNARLAALILNQPHVRSHLARRGTVIPEDTVFVAALHNTTTDELRFFDIENLSESHGNEILELQGLVKLASAATRSERAPTLNVSKVQRIADRARNWSEVRPEWGLAGNAAFVVGPRWMTKDAKLNGRVFLHQYDHDKDPGGNVLETIMTAPMIVTNWINLQYYASTVDNLHFGSGTKTVHNVVGQFGILSGNSGDLQTGLPWQSIHNGDHFVHHPLRLQVVIAAPRHVIGRIINDHTNVANLINNQWLHLIAIEDGQTYEYDGSEEWRQVTPSTRRPSVDGSDSEFKTPAELCR